MRLASAATTALQLALVAATAVGQRVQQVTAEAYVAQSGSLAQVESFSRDINDTDVRTYSFGAYIAEHCHHIRACILSCSGLRHKTCVVNCWQAGDLASAVLTIERASILDLSEGFVAPLPHQPPAPPPGSRPPAGGAESGQ
jgi:hypothetical protein